MWFNLFVCHIAGYLQGHKRPLEASRVLEEYAKVRKLMTFDVDYSLRHRIVCFAVNLSMVQITSGEKRSLVASQDLWHR